MFIEKSWDLPSIKVGSINYSVSLTHPLIDGDEVVWGCTDFRKSAICIDSELNNQKRKQVLMHELLHCCLHEAGLDDFCDDENLVNPLGNMLYQLFNENDIQNY